MDIFLGIILCFVCEHRSKMEDKAKALKEEGNVLYKQLKFEEALKRYSEASALQPQDPVYQSNISAVQFELGDYNNCIRTSDTALSLLSSSSSSATSNAGLSARLLLRKAKALFYLKHVSECKETLLSLSSLCQQNNIANPDSSLLDKVSPHIVSSSSSSPSLPKLSMFRAAADTRTPEYFMVGHDTISSCFNGTLTMSPSQTEALKDLDKPSFALKLHQFMLEAPRRINLSNNTNNNDNKDNNVSGNDQKEYAFLFGGIGDARHLYASLIDLETCSYPTTKRFHFTMVDIKAVVVARDLVVIYTLLQLAKFSREEMDTNIEAIELLALLHYTFLSTVMPPYLYDRLMQIIRQLKEDIEKKSLPNWILIDKVSAASVLPYLDDWLDFKVSTATMLKKTNGERGDALSAAMFNEAKNTHAPMPKDDPSSLMKSFMENMGDEELMEFPIPGDTIAEKREALNAFLNSPNMMNIARESMIDNLDGVENEFNTYRSVNTLYPPVALLDRHPEIEELEKAVGKETKRAHRKLKKSKRLQEFVNKHEMKEGPKRIEEEEDDQEENGEDLVDRRMQATKEAKEHIQKTFKPNPTTWDKWWIEVVTENEYEFMFSPFDAASNMCQTLHPLPAKATRLYDYMAAFFARVAISLKRFAIEHNNNDTPNVVLEWMVGDVYTVCDQIVNSRESRIQLNLAVEYDRIFMSNIPDYTGGNLPIAIYCAPLLKSIPHAYVSYNILLNTGVFKDYEECVRTYTLLPAIRDSNKYLAMNHFHGDLWGEDPKWAALPCPLPFSQLPSQDEVTSWLYRIFLNFVLPPQRGAMVKFRIDHPLNLLAYVNLLKRLAQVGYPKHWLAAVLDSLLSGSIKPFLPELELALSLCESQLPFRPLTSIPSFSSFKKVSFKIQFNGLNDQRATVVSLFLIPEKDANSTRMSRTSPYQSLRDDIVNGNPNSYLLSLLKWDSQKNRMEFWVEEKRLEKMVADDCLIFPVRLDSYSSLAFKPISLKKILEKTKQ